MNESYRTERRVEFRDTDAAGIMHFSTYFTYMEEVEHEFLRSVGWSVVRKVTGNVTLSWPRVSATCDYQQPSRFEDVLQIDLQLARIGDKSATYTFVFSNGEKQLAKGSVTAVCCQIEPGEAPIAVAIPADLRGHMERFLRDPES